MTPESQPVIGPQIIPITPGNPQRQLVAPVWHTIVMVALILLNSWGASGGHLSGTTKGSGRIFLYAGTFILQLVLFLLIWFGISRRKVKMRELIGGRWRTPEDFLIDLGF